MTRRRERGRNVVGVLLLDKPVGLTSNAALQRVKHLFHAAKAGHTGSLDPLATGLLPLCFGAATKFSSFLLDADKRYWVRMRLGVTTTTADAEGEIVASAPLVGIDEARVRAVLPEFLGVIEQLPPMYSAVKHQGQRLYQLARAGIEVVRAPRSVRIDRIEVLGCTLPDCDIEVHCAKGTYVRTLVHDIGVRLGCGAHVAALRRIGVGPYVEDTTPFVTLAEIERRRAQLAPADGMPASWSALDELLLPLDAALGHFPALRLAADAAFYLRQGQAVLVPRAPTAGLVRLYDPDQRFLGIGAILDDGKVQPQRLL